MIRRKSGFSGLMWAVILMHIICIYVYFFMKASAEYDTQEVAIESFEERSLIEAERLMNEIQAEIEAEIEAEMDEDQKALEAIKNGHLDSKPMASQLEDPKYQRVDIFECTGDVFGEFDENLEITIRFRGKNLKKVREGIHQSSPERFCYQFLTERTGEAINPESIFTGWKIGGYIVVNE